MFENGYQCRASYPKWLSNRIHDMLHEGSLNNWQVYHNYQNHVSVDEAFFLGDTSARFSTTCCTLSEQIPCHFLKKEKRMKQIKA